MGLYVRVTQKKKKKELYTDEKSTEVEIQKENNRKRKGSKLVQSKGKMNGRYFCFV